MRAASVRAASRVPGRRGPATPFAVDRDELSATPVDTRHLGALQGQPRHRCPVATPVATPRRSPPRTEPLLERIFQARPTGFGPVTFGSVDRLRWAANPLRRAVL